MILYPVEIDWMLWIFLLEKSWPPVTVPKNHSFSMQLKPTLRETTCPSPHITNSSQGCAVLQAPEGPFLVFVFVLPDHDFLCVSIR
jgi:hypothetical protein